MTVTERERRRMELVDGGAHRTELCEQLAMREYELDNLKDENAKLRELMRDYDKVLDDAVYVWGTVADFLGYGRKYDALHDRMMELGIEVGK